MVKHFPRVLLISLVFAFASSPARAGAMPSFDCSKATTPVERIICSNNVLAWQDQRLSELYMLARAKLPAASKRALVDAQREWLDARDLACPATNADADDITLNRPDADEGSSDDQVADDNSTYGVDPDNQGEVHLDEPAPTGIAACLVRSYQKRIAELQTQLSHGGVIRELHTDPWAAMRGPKLVGACMNTDPNGTEDLSGGPGGYSMGAHEGSSTTFLIGGKRYVIFTGKYDITWQAPRGVYESADYQENPPDNTYYAKCTLVLVENRPGTGNFDYTERENAILKLTDYLTGLPKSVPGRPAVSFARNLHEILPNSQITLVPSKGRTRHFQWHPKIGLYVERR